MTDPNPTTSKSETTLSQQISNSAALIQRRAGKRLERPLDLAIILGSGLGEFADTLDDAVHIPYSDIPNFMRSTIVGHSGNLVIGTLRHTSGKALNVACMQGRFHYYEGHALSSVTFPIRVLQVLGADTLLVTNAAGGINLDFQPGTLMMITDHINLLGTNPLLGPNIFDQNGQPVGPRFLDMSQAYDIALQSHLRQTAEQNGIALAQGVYAGLSGPVYETPAEIRMLRILGADAVGMSTVPEVIVARHIGMRVAGISCITNAATGITGEPITHKEVTETANRVKAQFITLISKAVENLPE